LFAINLYKPSFIEADYLKGNYLLTIVNRLTPAEKISAAYPL
jgi:hypothetical protein